MLNPNPDQSVLLENLKTIVGASGYREAADIDERQFKDPMGARAVLPPILLRPRCTEEVSAILKTCHAQLQPVAVQGGMSGLVSAAAPLEGEVALSLERLKEIEDVDPYSATMTVQAGVLLQHIQEQAQAHNLMFPLDLGARGSCTIGGNLATNAGGNRVIRFGMTRELVIGLEAVLADGTVINDIHKLRKNNSGYDLKQLFIGSEGTLGVITRAVLKLMPNPDSQQVALCGLGDFDTVRNFLLHAKTMLGANLSAFEVLWDNTYGLIDQHIAHVTVPLTDRHKFYVLVESMGSHAEQDGELFLNMLASAEESGLTDAAVVADSAWKIKNLWAVRDAAAEVYTGVGYMHTFDVSLDITDMGYFGNELERRLRQRWPEAILGLFGHVGDGNIHIIVSVGPETRRHLQAIDEAVYGLIRELHGSVSAEHGIGLMKKPYLPFSRGENEIALMRQLKQAMDPQGILNPGRVF